MTMIDPVTGWFKLAQFKNKPDVFVCQKRLDFMCLACYPQREIGFDNGGEFMAEFSTLCDNMGIKKCLPSS